jgi:acetolactate synthase-1/2/3 large subunit
VRAAALMQAIQRVIVDGSDAVVMTESGNAFAWGNHLLRFDEPGRYRVSVGFGSMGHFTAGVVGAALARGGKAVAVVGDGSMLMNGEVNTAVAAGARAVWVVLNDGGYGMVEHGMRALGFRPVQTEIPSVDFVALARSMGADGVRVEREVELDDALTAAMEAPGPFVVDVRVDPSEPGPWMKRIQALIAQGAKGGGVDEK